MRNDRVAFRDSGFTLIELTIVLVIVALLIGGMLLPLSAQRDLQSTSETQKQLSEIKEALIGFTVVNGHFPCPAISSSNGNEDRDTATKNCTGSKRNGVLPWVTLGVPASDAWGHLFMYSVTRSFSDSGTNFSLLTTRDITVKTRDSGGNLANLTKSDDVPVVVYSTGKNGYLSWTLDSGTQAADSPNQNDDEDTNTGSSATGKVFISRTQTGSTASGGEFDDIVTWISPNILFNRMIAAGKLP